MRAKRVKQTYMRVRAPQVNARRLSGSIGSRKQHIFQQQQQLRLRLHQTTDAYIRITHLGRIDEGKKRIIMQRDVGIGNAKA